MAGEATHPDLINGSLVGILSELEQDKTFLKLAAGDIEASDDVDNSVLAGIPEGLRPALAAAIGQGVAGKAGRAGRGLRPRSRRDRGLAALLV
jgi:transcription-repair coupling factor (superfamily II helicase)